MVFKLLPGTGSIIVAMELPVCSDRKFVTLADRELLYICIPVPVSWNM